MKKFCFLLIMFICSFMITNKQVFATQTAEPIKIKHFYDEPEYSDKSGYLVIYLRHKTTGVYWARTYAWRGVLFDNKLGTWGGDTTEYDQKPKFDVTAELNSSGLTMNFYSFGDDSDSVYMNFNVWFANENTYYPDYQYTEMTQLTGNDVKTVTWGAGNYDIVGYAYKGNLVRINATVSENLSFVQLWGSDSVEYSQLLDIIELLSTIQNQDSEYYDELKKTLDKIYSTNTDIKTAVTELLSITNRYIPALYDLLRVYVVSIDTELDEINSQLDTIITILQEWNNKELSQDTTPVDKDNVTINSESEKNLLGMGSLDMDSIDVTIDTSANDSLWSIITQFLGANGLIMGLFVTMLSLGLVKLVLNR